MNTQENIQESEDARQKRIKRLNKGIAAYDHERNVLLRLLRKHGVFSSQQFDLWFDRGREKHKTMRMHRYNVGRRHSMRHQWFNGETFILGAGINGGTYWAKMLHLLQIMIDIGEVDVGRNHKGIIVYSLSLGLVH